MQHSHDSVRAAALLTNRLVKLAVQPLAAREFWALAGRVDPGALLHATTTEIAERAGVPAEEAARLRTLLDAATAFGFAEERLGDGGVRLVPALAPEFPARLREQLGHGCPPFLLVAGPLDAVTRPGLGIVGTDTADERLHTVAADAARLAAQAAWPVITGLTGPADLAAIDACATAGGVAVGVPAEGITRVARRAEVRHRVHAGTLCLASPFAPDATPTATNATGRDRVVCGLAQLTLVVDAEAFDAGDAPVCVWTGAGAGPANTTLARRGATPIDDLTRLLAARPTPPPAQDPLF